MVRYLLYILLRTFTTSFNKIINLSTKLHQVLNLITHLICRWSHQVLKYLWTAFYTIVSTL